LRHLIGSLAVAGLIVAMSGEANAQQILTFDEMAPEPTQNPILGSIECAAPTGFRFYSDHFHVIGPNQVTDFSSSGSSHIGYESGRGFPITMERVGAGTFSLFSLDAGEFYSTHLADHPDAEWIEITGTQQNGTIVTHTIFIDGIRDGVGGVADYQHFVLPATFVNLRSVVFTGWRQGGVAGGIALDNLAYTFNPGETLPACSFFPIPSDTPTVSFVTPAAGNVSGTVAVQANASDNVGVVSVVFKLDGVDLGAPDFDAPYTISWDTTTVADGPHTLTVEARDASNNVGTASLAVTVNNNVVVPTGPHYVDLDGTDDYLSVSDAPALSFGNGSVDLPLTFEMWMRTDALGKHQLIGKWGESSNQEYKLQIAMGTIRLDLRDQSTGGMATVFTNGLPPMVGSWHHLAVTYDGRGGSTAADGITVYIDGTPFPVFRINDPAYVAMESLAAPVEIGREGPFWNQYNGGLDDIRMWNVARTQGQIQGAMAAELTGTEPGLVAYWRLNEGSGLSAGDDSVSTGTAALVNGTLWVAGGPLAPDVTAPDITNIATSNLTSSGVTISFTTSEAATGWVSYSATGACPCTDVFSAAVGTSHVITLSGLASDTTYTFTAKAHDAANNLQTAGALTFHTLAASTDVTPPVVTMVTPTGGTVVGSVAIEATASDNVGVVSVRFSVDGVYLAAADPTAPYTLSWDSTTVADGAHTLTAEARDAANNVATTSVGVLVQNAPVVIEPHYLELDGLDDYLSVADAADLSFATGAADLPLTIEMWMRTDAMSKHQLIGKWGESTNQEYRVLIAAGTIRVDLRDQSANAMASVFTSTLPAGGLIGAWHHLAVTYDGRGGATAADGITVYVDGVPMSLVRINDPAYVAMEPQAAPVEIGREGPFWNQYNGGLDEVRLWNVARTQSQIQAVMSVELTGVEAGLVAYWRFNEASGTASSDDSPANHTATLLAGVGRVAGGPLAPDTVAPNITGIVTSNVTTTGATISFNTNEPATGWVSYTATGACPCTDVFSAAAGTTHVVTLSGLASDTVYTFNVKAIDGASNLQTSAAMTFHTLVQSSDAQAPVVSIVSPAAGTVSGTVTADVTASDNVGVVSVEFLLDGVAIGPADLQAPYSAVWDTTGVADGAHTLSVVARDAANNEGTASVAVLVQNGAVVSSPHYLEFDGTDDYLSVADAADLSFATGAADRPLTIEMWMRTDAMSEHQLIGKWGESSNQEYRVLIAAGTIRVDLRDQSANAMASVFTSTLPAGGLIGAWHHLAVAYDGRGGATAADGIAIYIDGVPMSLYRMNDPAYVAMEPGSAPVEIGREGPFWSQYRGGLDEIRVWNVARTQSQIQAAMPVELLGVEAGLVAYWRFNEASGTTSTDDSPANHSATLTIPPQRVAGGPIGQ
jgi:hypothetical protein